MQAAGSELRKDYLVSMRRSKLLHPVTADMRREIDTQCRFKADGETVSCIAVGP